MILEFWQASLIAMISALCAIKILWPIAIDINLVDIPDDRKQHDGSVPLIGGLSIYFGLMVAIYITQPLPDNLFYLLMIASLVLLIGLLDDLKDLGIWPRILVQIISCLLLVLFTDTCITSLGSPFGSNEIELGKLAIPFTIFAVVGLVNAFNMSDGIDGLAGSLAIVTIIGIILFDAVTKNPPLLGFLLMFSAALLPYLFTNLISAQKIFLGDAGSLLIGFILAWILVFLSQGDSRSMVPTSVLWCVAIPVIDTFTVCFQRIRTGKSPLSADRQHFHHLLLDAGFSPKKALLIILFFASSLLVLGLILQRVFPSASLSIFILITLVYIYWSSVKKNAFTIDKNI
ncbi:MAG: undecaprenyl/decaprenyl-phosphate alpha-N-acetylglucosaminyl 1-phosphate transferase [Gammaproteobacteria bacterium]|nr:undecaprenyl/decaprenyl-phosphate alpha-N-acetylglucosaminyl 1-phosphate transferase [Gammaproteobacteria bacterium]